MSESEEKRPVTLAQVQDALDVQRERAELLGRIRAALLAGDTVTALELMCEYADVPPVKERMQ